ncbi:hypothetical protein ZWY2020_022747 [Hordeum vulgare]|nr:hypothetical protein ZWY2020_022747 [Hordeum vulgare]
MELSTYYPLGKPTRVWAKGVHGIYGEWTGSVRMWAGGGRQRRHVGCAQEQDVRSFEIIGHDMRLLVFDLKSEQKQKLSKIVEYFPNMRLLKEYQRLFCKWFPPGTGFEIQKSLEDKWWRVTEANSDYSLCSTYPSHLIVPRTISDEELQEMSTSRALSKHLLFPGSGAVLARSSQPIGIKNLKKYEDEKLVSALRTPGIHRTDSLRKLYIVDARPGVSDAHPRMCSESACSYPESEVVYLGIEDIHDMRVSFSSLRKYVDTHGSISSNGLPLAGPVTGDLEWLNHIQIILIGGSWIAEKIAHESASVLVHCSDGWDRTTQLVGLASLLLDPFYRTFTGFQALVEKDWLAFGHQFAERMGLPTLAKGGQPENPSVKSQASDNKTSPVLLQWLECIAQLMRMYPSAFEFSSAFLVDFIDAVLSCRFGNFLCNSEWEREQAEVESSCGDRECQYIEAVKTIKDAESRIIELKRMIAEENISRMVNSDAAKPSGGRK